MRALAALLLLALALAGCTSPTDTGSAGPRSGGDRALSFEDVEGCTSTQETELNVVVQDQAAWERLWRESCTGSLDPAAQRPAVDFTRNSVVASFWGTQRTGGYGTSILNITERGDRTLIEILRASPAPTCATIEVITHPAALAVSEKVTKRAEFTFKEQTYEC